METEEHIDINEKQIPAKEQLVVLRTLAESVARPGCKLLEVGSWCGDSAVVLGKVAQQNSGYLFCIDWWKGNVESNLMEIAYKKDVFSFFWDRIRREGLEDVVIPIRSRSDVSSEILKENMFGLVFIDADHRYEEVLRDIKQYAPLVSSNNGILCGHDCEGRISDFPEALLKAGKNVDYYESVHCGTVLAVGSTFKDYSINHSIWSVRANGKNGSWGPTNLVFPGIEDRRQLSPPPIGVTRNYVLLRYGKLIYAVPYHLSNFNIINEEDRKHPEVVSAPTLKKVEKLIGESVSFAAAPELVESYRGYNLIKFKDRIYAMSQDLGSINLAQEDDQNLKKYQEQHKCLIENSPYEVKHLIDQLLYHALQEDAEENRTKKDETIKALRAEGIKLRAEEIKKDERINALRGVSISSTPTAIFLDSYKGYNFVQYEDSIYAIAQALGPIDLGGKDKQKLRKYQKDNTCIIADSLYEAKFLVSRFSHQTVEKRLGERDKTICALRAEGLKKDETAEALRAEGLKKDETVEALQKKLEDIESTLLFRAVSWAKRIMKQ